jgi:SH3-like domain-containing protein
MWRIHLLVAAMAACAAADAAADEELPFEAYVIPAEAEVYSAPAEPRYATDAVPRGTKVEIYERRDEWLGIRPPSGSYSWVPSASMTMTDEPGVAAAATDGVASWIGSSAERVKEHASNVQLKKGERVEVLGQKEVASAEGRREVWLKIAPPAGEFRWIHASQVSREAPAAFEPVIGARDDDGQWATRPSPRLRATSGGTLAARKESVQLASHSSQASDEESDRQGPFRRSSMELRDLVPPPVRQAAFPEGETATLVQQAAHEAGDVQLARSPQSPDGFMPRKARGGHGRMLSAAPSGPSLLPAAATGRAASITPTKQFQPTANSEPAAQPLAGTETAGSSTGGIPSAQVQRRLEEIDVALSLMISGDRSQWNLGLLKREVQKLVEQGATPVDRGEARFMLEKIERFAEAFGVEEDDAPLDLPVGSVAARKAALEAATAPQYDGTGYLTPVRAQKPLAPYALLDKEGKRVCYVTPVPGFNLRPYENHQIGVFGKRGYMPDANSPHLLAERVVDLDKQAR